MAEKETTIKAGSMVTYVDEAGKELPALIVFLGSKGIANLRVFVNGPDIPFLLNVPYDKKGAPSSWHQSE